MANDILKAGLFMSLASGLACNTSSDKPVTTIDNSRRTFYFIDKSVNNSGNTNVNSGNIGLHERTFEGGDGFFGGNFSDGGGVIYSPSGRQKIIQNERGFGHVYEQRRQFGGFNRSFRDSRFRRRGF
jgi:hypothetical protein